MPTDIELVVDHLGGNRQAFADLHARYADRVHDVSVTGLGPSGAAADAYRDVFLVAARNLERLGDPGRVRPWLYSVARWQCHIRSGAWSRRFVPVDLAALVDAARARLNRDDREVLDLHLRHGLDGDEIGAVLRRPAHEAHRLVERVRDRIERPLGALLVARHDDHDCRALAVLRPSSVRRLSRLTRRRIARHLDDCVVCERCRRELLAAGGLAPVLPLATTPSALKTAMSAELGSAPGDPPPPPPGHEPRAWLDDGFPVDVSGS